MSIPTFHFVEVATTDRDTALATDAENASRVAVVNIQQQSTGVGQNRLPKTLQFPLAFRTEPHFTYGSAVVSGLQEGIYHDPRGSSGVWGWQKDARGYFTGANMWVRVDCEIVPETAAIVEDEIIELTQKLKQARAAQSAQHKKLVAALASARASLDETSVVVEHYMTFTAVAIKAVNSSNQLTNLNPRTIGL